MASPMKVGKATTTAPVRAGDRTCATPEFGRTPDATHVFRLKRGTLYNLHAQGQIRGVLLRVKGNKSGVRLWDMASIREYIQAQMETVETPTSSDAPGDRSIADDPTPKL